MVSERQVVCTAMMSGLLGVKGVFDALPDVGAAAEHAGAFGEGAGAGYGRFFKVSGEVGAVVGNAALGTVASLHARPQKAPTGLRMPVRWVLGERSSITFLPQSLAGWRGSSRAG